jgi:hypothetical protein
MIEQEIRTCLPGEIGAGERETRPRDGDSGDLDRKRRRRQGRPCRKGRETGEDEAAP